MDTTRAALDTVNSSIHHQQDITPEPISKVDARIKTVTSQVELLWNTLYEINQRLFRRIISMNSFQADLQAAQKIEVQIAEASGSLEDSMKFLPLLPEREAMAISWQKYFILSHRTQKLESCCKRTIQVLQSGQFQEVLKWYKELSEICVLLAPIVCIKDIEFAKFDTFFKRSEDLLSQFLDEKKGTEFVREQVRGLFEDGYALLLMTCNEINKTNKSQMDGLIANINLSLNKIPQAASVSSQGDDLNTLKIDKITLVGKEKFTSEYYLSGALSYHNTYSYSHYEKQWKFIPIAEKTMKQSRAFSFEVENFLPSVLEQDLGTITTTLLEKWSVALQAARKTQKEAIRQFSFNSMGIDFVNYMAFFSHRITEDGLELKRSNDFISKTNQRILQAQKHLMEYFRVPKARCGIETSYALGVSFYKAAKEYALYQSGNSSSTKTGIVQMVHETLAGKKSEALDEIAEEKLVCHTILRRESLDTLLYTGETSEGLPKVIQSWIIKRVAKTLYIDQSNHDGILDLVLFLLENDTWYKTQWGGKNSLFFQSVIDDFKNSSMIKERLDNELSDAALVYYSLLKPSFVAQQEELSYAKAVVEYVAFESKCAKDTRSIIKDFKKKVQEEFNSIAKKRSYILLGSDFRSLELAAPADTLKNCSLHSPDSEQEFLCMRVIATAIYGTGAEKQRAEAAVKDLLSNTTFSQFMSSSPIIYTLVCELAKVRVLQRGPKELSEYETTLLRDGPISEYLKSGGVVSLENDISLVLYRFIQLEIETPATWQGSMKKMVCDVLGEEKLQLWISNMKSFIEGIGELTVGAFMKKNSVNSIKKVLTDSLTQQQIQDLVKQLQ